MSNYKIAAEPGKHNVPRIHILGSFPNFTALDFPDFGTKVWYLCNIYHTATFGIGVKIGSYTEIGNNVWVGNDVTIGAYCFIPEGVTIKDDCWIGPRCTFTNDMYPPGKAEDWKPTILKEGARLGAGVTVLPGITIGESSLIGAGSVVTKNVPNNEIWAGVPARKINDIP